MTFDDFAGDYEERVEEALGFPGLDHARILAAKAGHLLDIVGRELGGAGERKVLDIGCGIGSMEDHLAGDGRRLYGTDVAIRPLFRARNRAARLGLVAYDGVDLPFADQSFDISFAASVFHHVEVRARRNLMTEMTRVTRLGGLVAILEHNPLNPLTRMIVARCSFDRDAILLGAREARELLRAGGLCGVASQYVLFAPWSTLGWRRLERRIGALPLGGQYIAFGRRGGSSMGAARVVEEP